jgi:hypothetical protein
MARALVSLLTVQTRMSATTSSAKVRRSETRFERQSSIPSLSAKTHDGPNRTADIRASSIGRNLHKSDPLLTWLEKWPPRYVELSRGYVQGHTRMPSHSIGFHFYFMSPRKVSLEYTRMTTAYHLSIAFPNLYASCRASFPRSEQKRYICLCSATAPKHQKRPTAVPGDIPSLQSWVSGDLDKRVSFTSERA